MTVKGIGKMNLLQLISNSKCPSVCPSVSFKEKVIFSALI